jgi:hypothetical protein
MVLPFKWFQLEWSGHMPLGPAAGGDDGVLEGPGLLAGADDDAVAGFVDAVDGCVGVDGCAVGLGGGCSCLVGAQSTVLRVVDGDVVEAEVALGVAFGHFLVAEDYVLGPVGAGGVQESGDVGVVDCADGESAAAGEDFLSGFGFEFGPEAAGTFQDGVGVGGAGVRSCEGAGVPAHGAMAVGGKRGSETG